MARLQALGDVFSAFAAALGAADKVIELIQRLPQMPDPGGLKPGSFSGHLELKDVEFSYPSRPDTRVLSGVSLSVKPGEASTGLMKGQSLAASPFSVGATRLFV